MQIYSKITNRKNLSVFFSIFSFVSQRPQNQQIQSASKLLPLIPTSHPHTYIQKIYKIPLLILLRLLKNNVTLHPEEQVSHYAQKTINQ